MHQLSVLLSAVVILLNSAATIPRPPAFAQEATPHADAAATPTPFTDQVFTGQGFVGEVAALPVGQAFVAVVVAEPGAGEEREIRVLLYGDRENDIREWFTGQSTGDRLELVSEGGAQLAGDWSPEGVSATITLPDDIIIPIDAVPISGMAGLYTVQVFPDGKVAGMSEAGVELDGQVTPEQRDDGSYPLTVTLRPPRGDPRAFEIAFFTEELGAGPPSRLVVLADGRMLGGAKRKEGDFFNGTQPIPA